MANYNDRNRNRTKTNPNWNDDNRNYRNPDFEYDRRRYDSAYGTESGRYDNNSDSYGGNDWSSNRGSTGVNRGSGNYSGREDKDWNNRGYSGSDYGRDRYSNDRNRNEDRGWWDKTKDEVSSWLGDDDAERRRRMDEVQGEHRGKGPKGYTRSDERIKEDVNDRLSDDAHIDASDIDVSVNNCEVTLTGTVNSRWEKRHAEDIAEATSGVKDVENRLKVSSNNTGTSATGSGSSGAAYGSSGAAPVGAFDTSKS